MASTLRRGSSAHARTLLGASGVLVTGACGTLWVAKLASPPEDTSSSNSKHVSAWWQRRTSNAEASTSMAAVEKSVVEAFAAAGVSRDVFFSSAKASWNGIEFCAQKLVGSSSSDLRQVVELWQRLGVFDTTPRVPVPETRRTYAQDVGSSAPVFLGRSVSAPRLSAEALDTALATLGSDGVTLVSGCVEEALIRQLRQHFHILGGGRNFACPSELPTTEVLAAAKGASPPLQPSEGRRHFLLRGTEFAEQQGSPLLAPLMPLVYQYFADQRPDLLPGSLISSKCFDSVPSFLRPMPHLFLSECQLLVSDPRAASQMWHNDNRHAGLTIIFPLTEVDDEVGPTNILPGTHAFFDGRTSGIMHGVQTLQRSGGAVRAAPLEPGSALIYDARLLHRGLGNSSYGRCRVVLVMRVDCVDTPPPGATVWQTTTARILGTLLNGLGHIYGILPTPHSLSR